MKKIWTNIPQLSLIILILALFKIILYYNNFNVPIKYYIGLSELGLLISDDLFIIIPVVFFAYLIGFVLDDETNNAKRQDSKFVLETNKDETSQRKGKIVRIFQKTGSYVIPGIFIVALVGGPIYFLFLHSYTYTILGISILVVDFFFFLFINQHERFEKLISSNGMMFSLFIVMFLIMFVLKTTGEIESVEKGAYTGTKIVTSDTTYISTDTAYYIGQTSRFVFYYNKVGNYTTVLPTSEIKKIELHSE